MSETLGLDKVSQGRHNHVHRGEPVDIQTGLSSLALGAATLLSYIRLAYSLDKEVCSASLIDLLQKLLSYQKRPRSLPELS